MCTEHVQNCSTNHNHRAAIQLQKERAMCTVDVFDLEHNARECYIEHAQGEVNTALLRNTHGKLTAKEETT